jgi:hypothetical protein
MTEYTQGLRVRVDEQPDDIDVQVRIRPEGDARDARKAGSLWHLDSLLSLAKEWK